MAAVSTGDGQERVVAFTDERVETEWAGADIGFKYDWIGMPDWPALMAGDPSKAEDLLSTCRSVLRVSEFTHNNIFDKLNGAMMAHKEKLCERLVKLRLGVSFEHFREEGEHEVTPEVRNRMWYEIEEVNFGCNLIVFGFVKGLARLFSVGSHGDIVSRDNFAAIGTGAVVAEAVLYQRQQSNHLTLKETLYNLYEAFKLANKARAPGVGGEPVVFVFESVENKIRPCVVDDDYLDKLANCFAEYGPREPENLPDLNASNFLECRRPEVLAEKSESKE